MENGQEVPIGDARDCGKKEGRESEAREEIEVHQVACGTVGLDEEENLAYERHPRGSDE